MALYASTAWEIRTDGSDSLNSGGFAPAAAGMPTDLVATNANTTSPVVTSASYSFQAGDVGHWLFVKSGTNWHPGWYPIVSVNAGAATIDASMAAVVRYRPWGNSTGTFAHTTSGCASVASPTGGTWAIDYSQASTRAFALTGVTTAGADAILLTASATKAMTGNVVKITAGTNFTTGYYAIIAVTTGVSITLDRTCTTAAGAAGEVSIGGALASIGGLYSPGVIIGNNTAYIRAGTYLVTTATANVPGGCVSVAHPTASFSSVQGYGSNRLDNTTRPIIRASGISSFTLLTYSTEMVIWANIEFDGAGLSNGRGILTNGNGRTLYLGNCVFRNFTNNGLSASGQRAVCAVNCLATGCSTQAAFHAGSFVTFKNCVAINNTATGFALAHAWALDCISANNTGATSDGFNTNGNNFANFIGCIAYGNGRDGIRIESAAGHALNCIAVSNGGYGVNVTTYLGFPMEGVAFWGNTSGEMITGGGHPVAWRPNTITLSANPFVDAANGDFRLNDTAGGGALLRAAGYPSAFPGLPLTTNFADIGAVQASPSRSGWGL